MNINENIDYLNRSFQSTLLMFPWWLYLFDQVVGMFVIYLFIFSIFCLYFYISSIQLYIYVFYIYVENKFKKLREYIQRCDDMKGLISNQLTCLETQKERWIELKQICNKQQQDLQVLQQDVASLYDYFWPDRENNN